MEPKVSVLIPVYNVENYLERCLNSVCNQSLEEIEIIIVDDGSTDGSGKIIGEFAKKDKRIIYLYQKNEGQAAARNAAIDLAKGKYISFVDSDDWIAEDMLQKLYNHAEKEDSDIVMSNIVRAFSLEHICSGSTLLEHSIEMTTENISKISYKYLFELEGASLCSKLYRATLIHNCGGNSGKVPLGEDLILNLKLLMFMPKISFINEDLYFYFVNTMSVTHKYAKDQISRFAIAIDESVAVANANGILEHIKEFLPLIAFRGFSTALFNGYTYNKGIFFMHSKMREMMKNEVYSYWIKVGIEYHSTNLISSKSNKLHTDLVFFLLSKRLYAFTTLIEWLRFLLVTRKKNI